MLGGRNDRTCGVAGRACTPAKARGPRARVGWRYPDGDRMTAQAYLARVLDLLTLLGETQKDTIEQAAALVADAWEKGGRLMVARTQHSLHHELVLRCSGPLAIAPLDDFGPPHDYVNFPHDREVTDLPQLKSGDVVLIHSNCGTTTKAITTALLARAKGAPIIALTALPFETNPAVPVHHPSGKRLHELADVTVDLGGDPTDGAIHIDGLDVPVGPTSGATGVAAAWMIVVRACERLAESGKIPAVLQGVQIPGAEERNNALARHWEETGLSYLPATR